MSQDQNSTILPVHLHVHSEYSLSDGMIRIPELVAQVKEWGQPAVALTDHSVLFGAIEFYLEAQKNNIKPIIGCELITEPTPSTKKHLHKMAQQKKLLEPLVFNRVHLAQSTAGYHQLIKLVSQGYTNSASKTLPSIKQSDLNKFSEDQFVLLSYHRSEFSYLTYLLREHTPPHTPLNIEQPANDLAATIIEAIKDHIAYLGSQCEQKNIYIELVDNNFPQDKVHLQDLHNLAQQLGLSTVATANAHYLRADDMAAHTILLGIKNDLKMNDLRHRRQNIRAHLFTPDEMLTIYKDFPEALHNTQVIADQCHVELSFGKFYLPKIQLQENQTTDDTLRQLAEKGLTKRLAQLTKQYGPTFDEEKQKTYWQRLEYELDVICKMGFSDYFLIVQDFINWAKEHQIPVGPGRGSGAGSLVAYALRITDLDPIRYNLIFERFLNPERVSMPDFDVDFCPEGRDDVINYVIEKYGKDHVAQITTFGKMMANAIVRNVGRVLGLSYSRVDRIAKLIPNDLGITLERAVQEEPRILEEARKDPTIKELLDYAFKLEGLSRHTSVHAAGIVISDKPMTDYLPIYKMEDSGLITQYDMKKSEMVGLVKFDFLGLKTLTVIKRCLALIKETTGTTLNIDEIPLDDRKVYELISSARSIGIFQLESTGMQQLLLKLQPSNFEDVIALVALFRPGPLGSGMVDDFVERKHGRKPIEYMLPQLEDILHETYGIILYQEQVQKIASVLANYTLGEADLLRRAMGKKIASEMAKQKSRFIEGAQSNNIDPQVAANIFDLMAEFAKYGFNKSHSAAYGLISYQTAYLKTHYTAEFLAASMTMDMHKTDKLTKYVKDARSFNIKVLPPCINNSQLDFSVPDRQSIRYGLAAIKGVGGGCLEELLANRRAHGPFQSLSELATRVNLHKVGKKTLELLTEAGALDCFGIQRPVILKLIAELVAYSEAQHKAKDQGQRLLFDDFEDIHNDQTCGFDQFSSLANTQVNLDQLVPNDDLIKEKKLLGAYISSHPIYFYEQDRQRFRTTKLKDIFIEGPKSKTSLSVIAILTDYFERRSREGKKMLVLRLEDETCEIAPQLFEEQYDMNQLPPLETAVICQIKVSKGYKDFGPRIHLESMESLDHWRQNNVKRLHIEYHVANDMTQPSHVETTNHQQTLKLLKKALENNQGQHRVSLSIHYPDAQVHFKELPIRTQLTDKLLVQIKNCPHSHEQINVDYH